MSFTFLAYYYVPFKQFNFREQKSVNINVNETLIFVAFVVPSFNNIFYVNL